MPSNAPSLPSAPGRATALVLGHRMQLHDFAADRFISPALARHGVFEPFQTEVMLNEVRPGDVVLDLGAHIGYCTLLLARLVGPSGRVVAFEPDPANFELLRRNVEGNGYRNVTLCPLAVSDRCGQARLYRSADNAGDHRLHASPEARPSVAVEAVSLDHVFRDYAGRVDLIKMDVQGSEGAALEGMRGLLGRLPRVKLLTEFWPAGLVRAGWSAERYLGQLQGQDFRLYAVDEERLGLGRVSAEQLLQGFPPGQERFTNLLCVKTLWEYDLRGG